MHSEDDGGLLPLLFIVALIAAGTWIVTLSHIALLIRSRTKRHGQREIDQGDQEIATDSRERERGYNENDRLSANFAALIRTIEDQGRRTRNEERREDKGSSFREGLTILLLSGTLLAIS